jgi:Ca2+-transporting ATPase
MRKTTASAFARPVVMPALLAGAGVLITVAATEVGFLQDWLVTTSLTGGQWLVCIALALVWASVVELEKMLRRRRPA